MEYKMIKSGFLVPPGFSAITLYPHIYIRKGIEPSKRLLKHEEIHLAQQKELGLFRFIILYIGWFLYLLLRFRNRKLAYKTIPFEVEARTLSFTKDTDYIRIRPKNAWKLYKPKF